MLENKVKVKHFKKKMNSWKPGKSIRNLKFDYKDCEFQMCIYPNGNTEDAKGFVSVFLQNNNNIKVCINSQLRMGKIRQKLDNQVIEADNGIGWPPPFIL